ncbi:HlyD family secretion protein [Swingsia samuiensis]|uniref:HlyD family secretion protein n=1 Tax=Swingsia samuiensis TaxID=1293412 RepID=A0A4Y6UL20_9PROT|nr:HlyD family secretion protein [Swingsia samuiensis]QDH17067.1 HlyD family secretion protein [Swingsia samuiensis]
MSQGDHENEQEQMIDKPKKRRSPVVKVALWLLVILVVLGVASYIFLTRNEVETDDAYTTGRKVAIAPHVNGYVTQLLVNDNQFVHKGDLLVTIDDRDYQASLDKARADVSQAMANIQAYKLMAEVARKNYPGQLLTAQGNLSAAKAELFRSETDYKRQHLVARAATSQQDIDYARAALDSARAHVLQAQGQLDQAEPVQANIGNADTRVSQGDATLKSAQAELKQAELNMEWTQVRAPNDGWISQRNVERGNFVQAGQQMFSIVEPEVWVVANYKETQLAHMRPGQKVDLEIDAYPQLKLKGHIDSLQLGSGESFSTFPPENATGNFVKTVQRIPVKILIDSGLDPHVPLALGLSVVPTVYTR